MLHFLPPLAEILPRSPGPYVSLMFVGFAISILGHMARSRWAVVVGIILIGIAAISFPVSGFLTKSSEDRPPPIRQFDI